MAKTFEEESFIELKKLFKHEKTVVDDKTLLNLIKENTIKGQSLDNTPYFEHYLFWGSFPPGRAVHRFTIKGIDRTIQRYLFITVFFGNVFGDDLALQITGRDTRLSYLTWRFNIYTDDPEADKTSFSAAFTHNNRKDNIDDMTIYDGITYRKFTSCFGKIVLWERIGNAGVTIYDECIRSFDIHPDG